jgi:hypothetical protein
MASNDDLLDVSGVHSAHAGEHAALPSSDPHQLRHRRHRVVSHEDTAAMQSLIRAM